MPTWAQVGGGADIRGSSIELYQALLLHDIVG